MRNLLYAALIAAAGILVAVGFSAPARAYVTVSGTDTQPGGYGVLTFRVLNESENASTTGLRVTLPETTYNVSAEHKDGWTATVTKRPLATPVTDTNGTVHNEYVAQVEWKLSRDSEAIKPGEFDTFTISAGPLPGQAQVSLPATQIYSDGTTVDWNEESIPGQLQAEHPAPVLTLISPTSPSDLDITEEDTTESVSDSTPLWPAVVAMVIGVAALAGAVANYLMLRSATIEDEDEDEDEPDDEAEDDDEEDDD